MSKCNVYKIEDAHGLFTAEFDSTQDIVLMATLNIALTFALVMFIICCTSAISYEQSRLLAAPLTEISRAVMDAGGAIFAGASQTRREMIDPNCDDAIVFDVGTVRRTLKRIAQIFNTKSQKVTMVYTPDDVVWTFNVKQQKEVATASHQTSHRLNKDGLRLLQKKTPKGTPDPKMEMRRNFIFKDFLHDPLATRYFHEFLEESSDSGCLMLDFYEEMQYIDENRKQLQDACVSMLEDFLETGNGEVLGWDEVKMHEVMERLQQSIRDEVSFGQMGGLSEEVRGYLRTEHFNQFLESHRFKKLEQIVHGVPKGIIVEREYHWMDDSSSSKSCGPEPASRKSHSPDGGGSALGSRKRSAEPPPDGNTGSTFTFRKKTRKPAIRRGDTIKANTRRFSLAGW